MAQKPTAKKTVAEDPRYTQALQSYEAGLRAMQEHKFDKAKPHFQKVLGRPQQRTGATAPPFISTSATSIWSARRPLSSRRRKSISTTPSR